MPDRLKAAQKILITGAQGFIGSQLSHTLTKEGYDVYGPSLEITDVVSIESAFQKVPFDSVIHLAGLSHVATCEKDPEKARRVNRDGTKLLTEAVLKYCPKAHFIFASTAQVYSAPEGDEITRGVIFDEDRKVGPQNTYAETKWAAEQILKNASDQLGLRVTILRLFNHSHHSQSPNAFLPHIYNTMKNHERGEKLEIPVGNIDLNRDIGSVQDLVRAFVAVLTKLSNHPPYQVFNVCSGSAKNLRSLSERLASRLGLLATFKVDSSRVRKGEPGVIRGSHEKLTKATGWEPHTPTEDALLDAFLA